VLQLHYLERALNEGHVLCGFKSENSIDRQVYWKNSNNGYNGYIYGTHIEESLLNTDPKFENIQYHYLGEEKKIYPQDAIEATRRLDKLLLNGYSFEISFEEGVYKFRLTKHVGQRLPNWVDRLLRIRNKKFIESNEDYTFCNRVFWKSRGFKFMTRYCRKDNSFPTEAISAPDGKHLMDAYCYNIEKVGTGKSIIDAINASFQADRVEIVTEF
jgi:hypothetical protein